MDYLFKTSDLEKLSAELGKRNYHCTPEDLNSILWNHRELLKFLNIHAKDDYRVFMYFLNGIGIDYDYSDTWELFFEVPKYHWQQRIKKMIDEILMGIVVLVSILFFIFVYLCLHRLQKELQINEWR